MVEQSSCAQDKPDESLADVFRPMRRSTQQIPAEEVDQVLNANTAAVLALQGDEAYPYAVPVSYAYDAEAARIIIHGAAVGHKMDAIAANPCVSLCVIDQDDIAPEKFTTDYRSVIVFGTARILEDAEEKRAALMAVAVKYTPDEAACAAEVEKTLERTGIIEIAIDHVTGKEGLYLMRARKARA